MAINEMTDLDDTVQRYQQTLADEFVNGNPQPFKALWSQREDVVLANPFGPAVRGWERASAAIDYASSRFSDGEFPLISASPPLSDVRMERGRSCTGTPTR